MLLPRRTGDWDWAQVQYETTTHHVDDIAAAIGVTATSLVARAARYGWTRDKTGKSQQQLVSMALAEKEKAKITAREIERVNIQMQADVLVRHRTDIQKARSLCMKLFVDLGDNTPEDLNESATILKKLADSMKTLILLERQAYGIQMALEDPEKPPEKPTADSSATDKVMERFAAILGKVDAAIPEPPVKDMGEVIEIGPHS